MIRVAVEARIATVTLDAPPVNAVGTAWLAEFERRLEELGRRYDWHVLHLRSALTVFCAGADLDEIRARIDAPDGAERAFAFTAARQRLYARSGRLAQVSLCESNGAALGGGLELALACDLRIVANEAKLGLQEARLGLVPGAGGTQRLSRLCGHALAARLILGAEVVDGQTAAALGLAQWAAPRADLRARAALIAGRLAELPSAALAAAKQCLAAACEPGRDGYLEELEQTRRLLATPETRRRIDAFLSGERREHGHRRSDRRDGEGA